MLSAQELRKGLEQFTGTLRFFRHPFGLTYTDGIHYLAENAECDWLINAIASHQPELLKNPMLQEFQLWILNVSNGAAVLTCWEDAPEADDIPAILQEFEPTNFPLSEIKLYVENSVLVLPMER